MPATPTPTPPADPRTAAAVDALARDVWEAGLEESPIWCTFLGDPRGADRLDERGPAARARRHARTQAFQQRLRALPRLPASDEAGLTQRVLERHLAEALEEPTHRLWQLDVDQLFGPHLLLAQVLSLQPVGDPAALGAVVARLQGTGAWFAAWEADVREGVEAGRLPARVAVERVLGQLKAMAAAAPEASPLAQPLARLPAATSAADRAQAAARVHAAIAQVVAPALARMAAFLEREVLPRSRVLPGLCHVEGGAEAYRWRLRSQTTTELTAQQVHDIGREELAGNLREIEAIARREGHVGDVRSFLAALGKDARFRLATREQILERYRAICARMQARLPEAFGLLPRRPFEVQPIEAYAEKDAPAAYYRPGPDSRPDPGVFYANTRDPETWPTYDFEALCFHEAVPGHHLQVALAQELAGLPALRRHGGFTAYVEGWAHYTERLADELGMYSTPYDRVGMLTAQAWRAARLVVDTGLHALGWSREQAVELLDSIRGGSPDDVRNEVDRYIVWPGQALSYKIGSRTITEVRARAKARLGARFTLAGFHDEVLRHGALPLSLLEEVLERWEPGAR